MTNIQKIGIGLAAVVLIAVLSLLNFILKPVGVAVGNAQGYVTQKVDDATNYQTIKRVEDTCRSYISSYEADKLRYLQYKDSDSEEQRSWGEQAKIRANTTASTYNNYILQNRFVWSGNVPSDIKSELEYLE